MPINYGSQIDEHHQVRRDAGMFDVSHMTVRRPEGDHARASSCASCSRTTSTSCKTPGKALYSCMLDERGGVIDDLIVYFVRRGLLPPGGECRDARQGPRLDRSAQAGPFGVTVIERDDLAMIAVQGPKARDSVHGAARTRRRGEGRASCRKFAALRGRRRCSSRAPATPARTATRSWCRRRRPSRSGSGCSRPA